MMKEHHVYSFCRSLRKTAHQRRQLDNGPSDKNPEVGVVACDGPKESLSLRFGDGGVDQMALVRDKVSMSIVTSGHRTTYTKVVRQPNSLPWIRQATINERNGGIIDSFDSSYPWS